MSARRIAGGAGDGATVCGAAIDSRSVAGGEAFFAFAGEHTDGHRFVTDALRRGAAAAVVEGRWLADHPESLEAWQPAASAAAVLEVEHGLEALHALTASVRRRVPQQLVGITGSAGKTSTKEILAHLLKQRFRTQRSPGNLNNLLGFPLALLALDEDTEWMVAEMGMSEPGELGRLSRLARPDVAVLTNVGSAHLERFGTVAAVAEAKAEILDGLASDGLLVTNAQDPQLRRIALRHHQRGFAGRHITFGRGTVVGAELVNVRAENLEPLSTGPGTRFRLRAEEAGRLPQEATVELPLHGAYNVDNFLAAAACAWALGMDLEVLAAAASGLHALAGRGAVLTLPGPVLVVDDVYNSNPEAVARALTSAADLAASSGCRRRWVVLGDMLELGETAPRLHRAAGAAAAAAGFDSLLAVGDFADDLVVGASSSGLSARSFPSAAAAAPVAAGHVRPGDLVLVKGSRGVALDAVVEALRTATGEGD